MQLNANGLSHIGLRVTDVARAKRFYVDTLGSQLVREIDGAVLINVYGMLFALYGDDYALFKKGSLRSFSSRVRSYRSCYRRPKYSKNLKQELDAAGVRNNGVEVDPETHDKYISFYDPDGIAWELYSVTDPPYV